MQREALLSYLTTNAARGDRLMRQIAAGKQILRPADAPTRVPQLLQLQQALVETDGYLGQIAEAKSWLSETDSVLGQVGDLLARVRELVVMAGSSTQNADGLAVIAEEVEQIEGGLLVLVNSRLANRYLFSGGTERAPFERGEDGKVVAVGAFHEMEREVAPDQTLRINTDGRQLFAGLFDLLHQIGEHLQEGAAGQEKLRTEDLAGLDSVLNRVFMERARVGVLAQHVESIGEQLVDLQVRLKQHLTELDGFDLARSITELRQQEASYEAALMVTARLSRLSLLDWLR